MRNILFITFHILIISKLLYGQEKFKVVEEETGTWLMIFHLINEKGALIKTLDTSKYVSISINKEELGYFAIFGLIDSSGWFAIDANENVLFKVYNTSNGEPSPDYLIENKIRIVDSNGLIGFANNKGEIIIKPQFEIASSFHNGNAIIGQKCKEVYWENHSKEDGCNHYSIICERYGYINEKGIVVKMGNYSFDQIMKEIDWKMPKN